MSENGIYLFDSVARIVCQCQDTSGFYEISDGKPSHMRKLVGVS